VSKWNHTAVFIEIWGQPYIIDAQKNGVTPKAYDKWMEEYGYFWMAHRNPSLTDHEAFSIKAMSVSGITGYDFTSLLIKQPWKIITGSWKKKDDESERMYCSEYAMWTHGIEKAYRMSPEDAFQYCHDHNWEFVK